LQSGPLAGAQPANFKPLAAACRRESEREGRPLSKAGSEAAGSEVASEAGSGVAVGSLGSGGGLVSGVVVGTGEVGGSLEEAGSMEDEVSSGQGAGSGQGALHHDLHRLAAARYGGDIGETYPQHPLAAAAAALLDGAAAAAAVGAAFTHPSPNS